MTGDVLEACTVSSQPRQTTHTLQTFIAHSHIPRDVAHPYGAAPHKRLQTKSADDPCSGLARLRL